jgi:hypothetical protein
MSQQEPRPKPPTQDKQASPPAAPPGPKPKLDLENLDLSVEEVEHRITPGETNVFDK